MSLSLRGIARRRFLQGATAAAVLSQAGALPGFAASGKQREAMAEFPYSAVKLTGGPLGEQYDWVRAHYLALDNDRLLKGYRERAGLPAPGAAMGGWYDPDGFVPGHSLGQYISGLARMGAATDDAACAAKVRALVTGFAATLGPENQSILRPKTNQWICYTLDKHYAGLIDAYHLTGMTEAADVLSRVLAGSQDLIPPEGHDRIGKKDPPYDETYVMPENLFLAWEITGNRGFRTLAEKYLLDREFFGPLSQGQDVLPGRHAYSHAIALSSAGKAYLLGGDPKYKRAMEHAWTFLTTEQQFASGGWGPNEQFLETHKGLRYASLASTVDHFETPCGSYAATKLARYLLRFTGDPRYGDNLERVVFNTILGVKRPDSDGDYPYYSTYSAAAKKVWYPAKWPCCSGTLVQTVADYVLNLYFRTPDGIALNLYAPSELRWKQGRQDVRLVQTTEYPHDESIHLRLELARPERFSVRLRIPGWAKDASLSVNGTKASGAVTPGTFMVLHRTWRNGDAVELRLPQAVRTEAIDEQHPDVVATMHGPLLYVAVNAPAEVAARPLALPDALRGEGEALVLPAGGKAIEFQPFYRVTDQSYTTYMKRG